LQIVLNGQAQPGIPVTIFPRPSFTSNVKTAAKAKRTAETGAQSSTADKAIIKPQSIADINRTKNDFPGWPWLVGGVSGFLVVVLAGAALFAVHLRRKSKQQTGGEPTASLHQGGEGQVAVSSHNPGSEQDESAKAFPESTENSGEITGPQAFLWAVQETGGPGLEQAPEKTGGFRLNPSFGSRRPRGKGAVGSPMLLSRAVQKMRERKSGLSEGEKEKDAGGTAGKGGAESEPGSPSDNVEQPPLQKETQVLSAELAEGEKETGSKGDSIRGEAGVRNGATLRAEKEDESPNAKGKTDGVPNIEKASEEKQHSFPAIPGQKIGLASPQVAQSSALWSPLTFSAVPSLFTDQPQSRKRRSPKAEPPKPRTPRNRKMSIFAPRKANAPAQKGKAKDREVWSPVRFVSPPVAKPGKIRRTEGRVETKRGDENAVRGTDQPRKALVFRPTPLDIPGATGPLRQSALWSPVKTFGQAQQVDILNVVDPKQGGCVLVASGKENVAGGRTTQPTRFKSNGESSKPAPAKRVSSNTGGKDEALESEEETATPLREEPSLWSPTFNYLMEAEATPKKAKASSGQVLSDGEGSPQAKKEMTRVGRRLPGRATLSSTSGAEIAALLQELERRTSGQTHTLSPYTAYEKLMADERRKGRNESRARLSFDSIEMAEETAGRALRAGELDSAKGVSVSFDVSSADAGVTLSAFVKV
jgi:hypothetical protein